MTRILLKMENTKSIDTSRGRSNRGTARGTVKIGVSMAIATGAGVIIQVYMARALQPELYGILAVVTSVILWWKMSTGNLFREATERAVAAAGEVWSDVAGTSARVSLLVSVVLAAVSWAVAPMIASAFGDECLTDYIRLLSIDIPIWVLMTGTWLAVLNGRRRYGGRAIASAAYWVAKAALMCGLVALGWSVRGALIGGIGASVVGLVVAWSLSGVGLPPARYPAKALLLFGLPLMALAIADRLILNMDLWLVKAIMPEAESAGLYGIGKYAFEAAMMLPLAVCGAAFPTLTGAIERVNVDSIRELIRESSRFTILLVAPMIAVMAASGREIVALVFGDAYAAAAPAIVILLIAAMLSGLRLVGNTTLIAASRPGVVLAVSAPLVPLNIWLNYVLVSSHGLIGAAVATAITLLLAAVPVWWLVWRRFKTVPSVISAAKVSISAVVACWVGLLIPAQGWQVLVEGAGICLLYLLLLLALRELRMRDLEPLAFWR